MFNPFKNWLGIEGIKLELLIPEEVKKADGFIDGRVIFSTKQLQIVESLEIKIVEKYTRGKGDNIRTDEYEIGNITRNQPLEVKAFENIYLDFALPFQLMTSDIDELGRRNILTKNIAQIAKTWHQVQSEYKVIATAKVKGTALDPFQEKNISIL